MDGILRILTENLIADGAGRTARFVFPTQVTAFFWARKALSVCGVKTLALEQFLAWDKFKESCIKAEIAGLKPANAVHRNIFAVNLAERNAKDGLFQTLIPKKYAGYGTIFARSIARALPFLRLWRENYGRLQKTNSEQPSLFENDSAPDENDRDILTLENEYKQFLSKHALFESAWERPPFRETENKYFIFYPELIEDFAEHEKLLESPDIKIITLDARAKAGPLYQFDSAREELRAAILEMRRLYEQEKIPYEDMAVSAGDLETLEPYIARDAAIYDVPLHPRSGKPLARYGAGRFFSLAKECVSASFSFQALKALLLNNHLPWRSPEKNERLIRFGIKNNCVSGYREDGKLKDVWEEAFRAEKSDLYPYYKDIKHKLTALVNSKSFEEIRVKYFIFRGDWDNEAGESLFSKNACSAESYDVIARCVEELSALIQIQNTIPDVVVSGSMDFYTELLNERRYVPERGEGGVNVFQYGVAAGAPFAAHFVLNVNQKNAAVIYRGLKFPLAGSRGALAGEDRDASPDFFRAYGTGQPGHLWFSASRLTFSGWTIPHSFFNDSLAAFDCDEFVDGADYYAAEKNWWAGEDAQFPARLFPVQKNGFAFWKKAHSPRPFSLLKTPLADTGELSALLRSTIAEKKYEDGLLRVSATDLQSFYKCAAFWLFENIFDIEEETLEARLLDDRSRGLLFHTILHNLFERIKQDDKTFTAANIEKYRDWARAYTEQAALEYRAFDGPLCAPLVGAMTAGILRHINALLEIEAEKFDGYAVLELEAEKKVKYADFILNGRLDRVSVSGEGGRCIVDYKMGKPPAKKDCTLSDEGKLSNFQIPVYVKLFEESNLAPVDEAVFISVAGHEAQKIIDNGKTNRDDYQPTMEALETYLYKYAGKVKALDFRKNDVPFDVCVECIYKKICRTTFALNET